MPRPRMLNPVEKIDAQIEELRRDREILQKYYPMNGARKVYKVNRKERSKRIDTLETMRLLVKERKRPLSIDEFYEGLKAKGWKSDNKEPRKTIWAVIGRGGFKKTKPGFYTVKG